MAFDGITIANMVNEFQDTIVGGKINKIAQPEADELLITIKNNKIQYRLLISASASLPLIYFTKHIGSGKIISVTQPDMERAIEFRIEHLNELGDLCYKTLVVEIMGKHSNIIFLNEERMILDSIKHISGNVSSVREVLPGRDYFLPKTQEKYNPLTVSEEAFFSFVCEKPTTLAKALYTSLTGISPCIAEERASLDGSQPAKSLDGPAKEHLFHTFARVMEDVKEGNFQPNIVYNEKEEPVEYAALPLTKYGNAPVKKFSSMSQVLEQYYAQKDQITRIRQKSSDLRRIVQTALERNRKKLDLQSKQMKDTQKMNKYKVYGELINTYGYNLEEGCKSFKALNYYTNEEITIPLDPTMSPQENAKKYFDRYNKLKRTAQALEEQLKDTQEEIQHLESIGTALDIALQENDLSQIKDELTEYGYIKKHYSGKRKKAMAKSKPLHYISSDGYHIYVGKNNYQNDELTFKFATGNDWWFHAKKMAGSHVIVKSNNEELPDRTFEEAGRLAAYYSSGRTAPKVEIDYIQKKHVKKPNGAKPGFVVYYTNYSLMIEPDISGIEQVE